ncbi:MAG TPA: NnrS family protein [Bauldia sp.]|nr:NnrS family protein [Bauldia sp.]
MPPILQYGFRPFFFSAALYAAFAVPFWVWTYVGGPAPEGPFDGVAWHAHEMIFGYLGAVLAGFILTAVPNWTGRLPLSGWPLAGLVGLWLAGRLACALVPAPTPAMALDLAFPAVLAIAVWREVLAGRNWKNAPIALMLTSFGIATGIDHLAAMGHAPDRLGTRLALAVATVLIVLVGGRIVPSFTRNWLAKQGATRFPASFGRLDSAAIVATVGAAFGWVVAPDATATGLVLLVACVLVGLRLFRWRGVATLSEPILLILHIGYAWLTVSLGLLGLAAVAPGIFPAEAGLHALAAGAVGTMTLAVMTRASLGHTGRPIIADHSTLGIYGFVTLGALLRVAAPFADGWYLAVLLAGGGLWSAAFLLFAIRYAPVLWGRRVGS